MGRWYSLPAAQRKVGLRGTRGKRLLTFLRRAERDEGLSLVRERLTATGRIRREVNELTLLRFFPDAFEKDLGELGLGRLRSRRVSERARRHSAVPTSEVATRSLGEVARKGDAVRTTRGRGKPF